MVQTKSALERFPEFFIFTLLDFDEAISLDATFKNILEIDSRKIGDSVVVMFNPVANGVNLEYRIYATAKQADVIPPDSDDSWINILRDPQNVDDFDPATYDHLLFKAIPAGKRFYESFSNQFSFVRVSARLVSGTGTMKCWGRGASGGL